MTSPLAVKIIDKMHEGIPRKEWYLARNRFAELLADESPEYVVSLAHELWATDQNVLMWAAVHLIHLHPKAILHVRVSDLEKMGASLDGWGDVDTFCSLSCTLWRLGRLSDARIRRWARSEGRWWRRSALVTMVAKPPKKTRYRRELIKTHGAHLDPDRILPFCEMLVADRDDMVVKAMSWVLRDLSVPHPEVVRRFLEKHQEALAARVLREVRNKLETGVKNPRGGLRARKGAAH